MSPTSEDFPAPETPVTQIHPVTDNGGRERASGAAVAVELRADHFHSLLAEAQRIDDDPTLVHREQYADSMNE